MRVFFLSLAACLLFSVSASATEVQEIVTPKGITAWLVEEHALPLLAVNVAFRDSGSAYDPPGKSGRASLMAAMMMEGAGDLRSEAFNEALENHAIRLNFSVEEETFRASMETLSEEKEEAFNLLGLALTKPRFDDDALERARAQALSTIQQQEREPGYMLRRLWQNTSFPHHPYSNALLGDKDSVSKLSKNDMIDNAQRYLTRQNMLIAVVGDITPQALAKLIDDHFAALPASYNPDVTISDVTMSGQGQQIHEELDIPQTVVAFGTIGIKRNDPDYYSAYVMNQLLGGGGSLNTRLAKEVREKRGLTYSIYSQLKPMMHTANWLGSFSTRTEKTDESITTLRSTLKTFVDKGPDDAELADAKRYIIGSFVLNLDSNAEIADYLTSMQLYHLGRDYLDKRNGYIAAVQKKDVVRATHRLIDPDKLLVVTVGKSVGTK